MPERRINGVKKASQIVAKVHKELKAMIRPGVTTKELDQKAYDIIVGEGAVPTFLGYNNFPATICSSVNEVLIHGIPNDTPLKEGDIISIDVGAKIDGYCGDAAFTAPVGEVSERKKLLLKASKEALEAGINAAKAGNTTGDIGFAVQSVVEGYGFSVPIEFTGHGIGEEMHMDPYVPNYGQPGQGSVLKEGQTICIEPMLIDGEPDLFVDPSDNWTVRPRHGGNCAHDEHTVVVRKDKGEPLTI